MTADVVSHYKEWWLNVLTAAKPHFFTILTNRIKYRRYGRSDDALDLQHHVLKRLMLYLNLLWLETYNYNRFQREDGDCNYKTPNDFAEEKLIRCFIRQAKCHGLNIQPIFNAALYQTGIGVMVVEDGCEPLLKLN